MPSIPGHQRNVSQGQHLIVDRNESEDEEKEVVENRSDRNMQEVITVEDDAVYGNGGVYPGSSPPYTPSRPHNNTSSGMCSPQLRSNIKVILGSVVLTIVGIVLLVLGTLAVLDPEDGMQHWVFFFAGLVCFIPGFYHVFYVTCTLCGRPGYSFDKLPTFNR